MKKQLFTSKVILGFDSSNTQKARQIFEYRVIMVLVMILLFLIFSCNNDDEPAIPEPTTLEGKIEQYLQRHQDSNRPGLSIAIRKDDQIVFQGNAGMAQVDNNLPINSETQFRIASISKPITALAIMQLVEVGVLDLDDKLLSFYPSLPQNFKDITLKHLLAHRSGMLDYIDDNTNLASLDNLLTSEVLHFFDGSGLENLNFDPGTMGRYSNTGYVLLGLVIEKATGTSLPQYLAQKIFNPAEMTNTFVISEHEHLGDHGDNYALSFGTDIKVKGFNSLIYGASGVVSTTSDLMKLIEALLDYRIVSKTTLELMTQSQGSLPDIETDYGLGWLTGTGSYWHTGRITDPNDFWHSGGFDGYQTVLSINPDVNLEVAILSNGGNDTKEKMWDILELSRNHFK